MNIYISNNILPFFKKTLAMRSSFTVRNSRISRFLTVSIGLCTSLLFSSCLKDSMLGPSSGPNSESIISGLSVIHASPDAPAFDFVLNGEPIFPSNRSFTKYIPYSLLFAGKYQARFYVHDTYTNAFYTSDITLAKGKYHSLFLAGLKVDSLTTLLLEDDLTRPKEGNAKLRFVNLSPDAGALDFSIVEDSLFASKKNFKGYTAFYEIKAGEYTGRFKSSEGKPVHYDFILNLENGKTYTVWAKGLIETANKDRAFGNGLIIHDLKW